jgi:hypothetical protein
MQIKRFIIIILLALFSLYAPIQTHAQVSSNTTTTRVGNPTTQSPTGNANIMTWVNQIASNLETGYDGAHNRMLADISNGSYSALKRTGENVEQVYWCTYIVIDSYNLAGISGLSLSQASVAEMVKFWKRTSGYKYLDYDNASDKSSILRQVKAGDAFFQESVAEQWTGSEHVSIVESISIDGNGNGSIKTIDSNARSIYYTFPIDNWTVQNLFYPLRGFGSI